MSTFISQLHIEARLWVNGRSLMSSSRPRIPCVSVLLRLHRRSQRDGCLSREHQKSERLLQIQADRGIGMHQIANGDVLADMQVEIAATGGHHKSAANRGRPDDFVLDESLNMFQYRVSVIAGLSQCGVNVGIEEH